MTDGSRPQLTEELRAYGTVLDTAASARAAHADGDSRAPVHLGAASVRRRGPKRAWLAAAAAVIVIMVVVAAGVALTSNRDTTPTNPAPPVGRTKTFKGQGVTMKYPAAWSIQTPILSEPPPEAPPEVKKELAKDANGSLVALSNQAQTAMCTPTAAVTPGGRPGFQCGPTTVSELEPNSMVMRWDWCPQNLDCAPTSPGEPIDVGGQPAERFAIQGSGDCLTGGTSREWIVSGTSPAPSNRGFAIRACFRGPHYQRLGRQLEATLRSVRFRSERQSTAVRPTSPSTAAVAGPAAKVCHPNLATYGSAVLPKAVRAFVRDGAETQKVNALSTALLMGECHHIASGGYSSNVGDRGITNRRVELDFYAIATPADLDAVADILRASGFFTTIKVAKPA